MSVGVFLRKEGVDANMGFPGGSVVKNPPVKQEMQVQSLG